MLKMLTDVMHIGLTVTVNLHIFKGGDEDCLHMLFLEIVGYHVGADELALRKDFLLDAIRKLKTAQIVDIKEDVVDELTGALPHLLGGIKLGDMCAVFATQMSDDDTGTLGVTLTHIVSDFYQGIGSAAHG